MRACLELLDRRSACSALSIDSRADAWRAVLKRFACRALMRASPASPPPLPLLPPFSLLEASVPSEPLLQLRAALLPLLLDLQRGYLSRRQLLLRERRLLRAGDACRRPPTR